MLVSAGKGERLGANMPKAAVKIGSRSLLEIALSNIVDFAPDQLVVVAPTERLEEFQEISKRYFPAVIVVAGGATRQESVSNGLEQVTSNLVLVHDAARSLTPSHVFRAVATALEVESCAIPVLAIPDTVKQIQGQFVEGTVDRGNLRLSQTPQGFRVAALREALGNAQEDFTDEAALMEAAGHRVVTVQGDERSFKITTPADLERAAMMLGEVSTGIGVDAHAFSDSGSLVLGCLTWPEFPKLEGHSDGDSVAHAIVDSLLSAAGLGDIGSNFGVDRPEFRGASGEVFISGALELLATHGYEPVNVAVQIVADRPKIGPRRAELEQKLSGHLGAKVSVLATTTDGLGFLADSKGVAAVATALIRKRG